MTKLLKPAVLWEAWQEVRAWSKLCAMPGPRPWIPTTVVTAVPSISLTGCVARPRAEDRLQCGQETSALVPSPLAGVSGMSASLSLSFLNFKREVIFLVWLIHMIVVERERN